MSKSNYTFTTTKLGTLVIQLPDNLRLVQHFLIDDVGELNGPRYIDALKKTLYSGAEIELTGNSTTLKISKEKTQVINNILEESIDVETEQLLEIVTAYIEKQDFMKDIKSFEKQVTAIIEAATEDLIKKRDILAAKHVLQKMNLSIAEFENDIKKVN